MLLSMLLSDCEISSEYQDCEVLDVTSNSNEVTKNSVYVCIRGVKIDGHAFAKEAIKKGAICIICEEDLAIPNQIIVINTRLCYTSMCKNLFGRKCDELILIATTGTNGKTSVSTIIKQMLLKADIKAGLISTIQAEYGDNYKVLETTTPDAHKLHELFAIMHEDGCKAVALEASSHALDQKRLEFCNFEVAVFTNLTQDHLDYHKDMEEYFNAKKRLFSMAKCAIINIDDNYGKRLCGEIPCPFSTYSTIDNTADFFADEIIYKKNGVEFILHHNEIQGKVSFAIPGLYSVQNALASIAAGIKLGISLDKIIVALAEVKVIMGRSEIIETNKPFSVICDYAHTPDGLENILKSTKEYAKGRVIALFGCGGDRDKSKRQQMAEIASKYADFLIVTSDNPRTENPSRIISDILKGIPKGQKFIVIVNRTDAIRFAISSARRNDTIILAGKGHEQYQVLGDKKIYYDERRIVRGFINSHKDVL